MTTLRNSTVACSRSFRLLAVALEDGDTTHRALIDPANLEDEYGRFRVWSGNLGAQQKGHSSLDYRLRDSPLLQSNVLKLLRELETNLNEARAVVSGARLPYEQQANSADFSDDSASDDSEEEDDDSEEERPKFELQQRMFEVIDILDNLYRISIRIRSPTIRTRALKAASYRQVDPQTGVDVFSQYAAYDRRYTEDALAQLRTGFPRRQDGDVAFLVERLGKAITKRRQQFKYWRKHRDKLANSSATEDIGAPAVHDHVSPRPMNGPETAKNAQEMVKINLRAPPSEAQPRTLLSGTEATAHHRTLDDAVDSQSVTSVATTARDLGGHGIDLPPPPTSADGEKDFECPYCFVICPARYARTRSWKTHLLQDLQPYVCTYKDCNEADHLFRNRREWLEHESSAHRKVWRCPGHPAAVYSSRGAIQHHLEAAHGDDLTEMQVKQLISVAETSTDDLRAFCPICFADANDPNMSGNFHNHIANHLERFASFALPKFAGPEDDKSGASMDASHGRGSSSDKSQAASTHWSTETASVDEGGRPDSNHTALGFTVTADDMIERLLALLGKIEHSKRDPGHFCEEDWLKVRPTLASFFPQPEASQVFVLLDDLFLNVRDDHTDFELLRSHIRGLMPSRDQHLPASAKGQGALQGDATLESQYPQVGEVQRLAWSTYLECQDQEPPTKQPARLQNDVFTIHSTLSTLALVSNIDASILGYYLIQALQGATQTLTEIQAAIDQSKPYAIGEDLARSLCKKLAVWIWRFDALRLSQAASNTERPKLSADAIHAVPDASHDKMDRFMENSAPGEKENSTGSFEIHAIDLPTEKLKKELTALETTKEPDIPYTLRVSNLPTEPGEKERFATLFADMGFKRFWVDPDDETRGYAKFRTLEDAKRALSNFDVSNFPGIGLEIANVDEKQTEKAGSPQTDHFADFNVEKFLENLSSVLEKPEYGRCIAWAEDGKSFHIVDKESFSREVLPTFELGDFPAFRRRLVACGFREAFGWKTLGTVEVPELRHDVTWHHNLFHRDKKDGKNRIRLLARLKEWFNQTKQLPRAGQIDTRDSAAHMDPFRFRSRFALKSVADIPTISELYLTGALKPIQNVEERYLPLPEEDFNQKISMLQHDITMLDVDAIVNATTTGLTAGASDSISYWIHRAAGRGLQQECNNINTTCEMGQAIMTGAYNLPCRKIIHTVRPHYFQAATFTGHEDSLANCYRSCLKLAVESGLRSIAFPCLSAGGFGFPSREAATIALNTTRAFLDAGHGDSLQRIVFCVYRDPDRNMYKAVIPLVFPPSRTDTASPEGREAREESPSSLEDYGGDETPSQAHESVFDMDPDGPGPSKSARATPSRLGGSVESLSRLTGLPSLWACCKCRARPMETPNCLVCYHELCDNCKGEGINSEGPTLSLVYLHPSSNMLEKSQESGLSSLERRDLVSEENQARGSIRSRPNSPTGGYHPTYVKVHRKHLSLDTLFYYDLPFEFDNKNLDHIIIMRELSEEQTRTLFEHSRRHRRNLPSIIRTRTHPNPLSPFLTIRIGSNHAFNTGDHHPVDGAPIFLPEPFVTADHCDFYIDAAQRRWMLEVNRAPGTTFLNGRRLVRLPVPDDKNGDEDNPEDDEGNHTALLPPHDTRGYVVRSGDILGLGETDAGKPVYLFRIEVGSIVVEDDPSGEHALWEEAEARASRYGFPTIGLDEDGGTRDDDGDGDPFGSGNESNSEIVPADDGEDDDDDDPEVSAGYKIVDAPTVVNEPAQRWTKLDRRLVNPDALKEAGLHYEHRVRYLLVFRELGPGEVARLAARTRDSREAKTEAELTRKERRRKERRVREQVKKARERKSQMGALAGV